MIISSVLRKNHTATLIKLAFILLVALAVMLCGAQVSDAVGTAALDGEKSHSAAAAQEAPVEISGVARPGDRVFVYEGERLLGETVAGQDGKWRFSFPGLLPGQRDVRVKMTPPPAIPGLRGGTTPPPTATPEPQVTITVSVVAAGKRVTVTVVVNSPNGEVSVVVSLPIDAEQPSQDDSKETDCSPSWYTVRKGDTLTKIASWYGTTATYLAKLNGLKNPDRIYVGQTLCVRAAR